MNSTAWAAGILMILVAVSGRDAHGIDLDLHMIAASIFFLAGVVAEKG